MAACSPRPFRHTKDSVTEPEIQSSTLLAMPDPVPLVWTVTMIATPNTLQVWRQGITSRKLCWFLIKCLLCIPLVSFANAELNLPTSADVRVLIDISGSMKKNDPDNLRQPALNLITELLPDGDKAGVWTFGQYVNELVRHQPVDDQWRKLARQKAQEINSVALFTNIGAVLERASEDLQSGQDYSDTHFILLTDGVVDISQNAAENAAERERIQTQVIKRFTQLKAKIHTIALSRNADQVILRKLSVATDGIAALAETPDELSRVFLQAFERASPSEEVPIEDNAFDVDSSVEEFTALIFRASDVDDTRLIEPSGKQFSAQEYPDYIKWFKQDDYDLITVKQPLEGQWKLDVDLAEGSKITVVSNLRLVFEPLPGNFYAGDQLEIRTGLFEDGKQVTDPAFLDLVSVGITITTEDNKSGSKIISDSGKPPADGIFREQITRLKKVGRYQVMVEADGRTFKRQSRQLIQLNPPMSAELEATGTGADSRYRVLVNALSPNIDVAGTSLVARIKAPDGANLIKSVTYNNVSRRWELDIEPSKGDGIYQVSLRVDGKTSSGNQFRFEPDLISAGFPRQEASPNEFRSLMDDTKAAGVNDILADESELKTAVETTTTMDEARAEPPPAELERESAELAEDVGMSMATLIAIGGGTALIAILSGLGLWLLKRKRADDSLLKERTSNQQREAKPVAAADELDLEDEIEQLEKPSTIADNPDSSFEDMLEDDEFSMDASDAAELSDITDKPETESVQEPIREPEQEPDDFPELDIDEAMTQTEALPEASPEEDEEDEFNLEDFDISDTDDLPAPEDEKK